MSSKHRMIWLTPPVYGSKEERIESRGYTCEYCHGQGGFLGDRSSPNEANGKYALCVRAAARWTPK